MANLVCIIETDKIVNGTNLMKNNTNLVKWDSDLSSLVEGGNMFDSCTNLTSFSGNLSSLTNGSHMFYDCNLDADSVRNITLTINKLESGVSRLDLGVNTSILTNTQTKNDFGVIAYKGWTLLIVNGEPSSYTPWSSQKYYGCTNLNDMQAVDSNYLTTDIIGGKWTEHLCDLENGRNMFVTVGSSLTSFSGDLSSLTNGIFMFAYTSLISFTGDLSSLTNGNSMFSRTSLTTFNSELSSLTNGRSMFSNCELNTKSIKRIADTIKDVTELTNSSDVNEGICKEINLDISNTTPTTEEQGYLTTIASKGWTVYVNGSAYTPTGVASAMTLDEDGNEMETPIPYYAKPIASDEAHAEYIDAEGNYFNIVGAQFIYGDDLSTYGMFTCEEDAAFNIGLTKIDK